MIPRTLSLLFLALALQGCATLGNGSRQRVDFNTTPAGATVRSDGVELCQTPCSAELTRSDEHTITLQLAGHYPYRMTMRVRGSNWMALYALFPNPLFIGIDLATGSAWFLTPEEGLNRQLDPLVGAAAAPGGQVSAHD